MTNSVRAPYSLDGPVYSLPNVTQLYYLRGSREHTAGFYPGVHLLTAVFSLRLSDDIIGFLTAEGKRHYPIHLKPLKMYHIPSPEF